MKTHKSVKVNVSCCVWFVHRLSECLDSEAETVMQLRSELREKEMKLTDIRLEALSSAHQLDQLREAMNRMQVCRYVRLVDLVLQTLTWTYIYFSILPLFISIGGD